MGTCLASVLAGIAWASGGGVEQPGNGMAPLAMSVASLCTSSVSLGVAVRLAYHRGRMDERLERLDRLTERFLPDDRFAPYAARIDATAREVEEIKKEIGGVKLSMARQGLE